MSAPTFWKASSKRSAQVRKRTGAAPDLFSFCLGGTLVAIALAYLAAKGRDKEVNTATLIGSLVDFSDMRDGRHSFTKATVRARRASRAAGLCRQPGAAAAVCGDARERPHLVVGGEPLSARPAGAAADLLYWFEDGARIPRAFLRATIATCCQQRAQGAAGFAVGGTIDSAAVETPMLAIALKDDHVSAWEAVYDGAAPGARSCSADRAQCRSDQSARRQQARLLDQRREAGDAKAWLASASRHEGSWWPWWVKWLECPRQRA